MPHTPPPPLRQLDRDRTALARVLHSNGLNRRDIGAILRVPSHWVDRIIAGGAAPSPPAHTPAA